MLYHSGSSNYYRIHRGPGKEVSLRLHRYDYPIRAFYALGIDDTVKSPGLYLFTKACRRFNYRPTNVRLLSSKEFACYFIADKYGDAQVTACQPCRAQEEDAVTNCEEEEEAASTAEAEPPTFNVTGIKGALFVLAIGIAFAIANCPTITH